LASNWTDGFASMDWLKWRARGQTAAAKAISVWVPHSGHGLIDAEIDEDNLNPRLDRCDAARIARVGLIGGWRQRNGAGDLMVIREEHGGGDGRERRGRRGFLG
jgi:hypothetical protein